MISLLNSFTINPEALFGLLTRTNSFIAGGAAVHALHDGRPEDFTGDIDIWYQEAPDRIGPSATPTPNGEYVTGPPASPESIQHFKTAFQEFVSFFTSHGYRWDNCPDLGPTDFNSNKQFREYQQANHDELRQYLDKSTKLASIIRKIITFSKGGHKIQVIFSYRNKAEILASYDYSFCAVAYDHETDSFDGIHMDMTRRHQGVQLNVPNSIDRGQSRLEKYQARGFTLVEAAA